MLALMLMSACASAPLIEQSASLAAQPEWTLKPPTSAEAVYFVGLASRALSLEEGSEAARQNAMAQIAKYLGCSIQTVFIENSSEAGQHVTQRIATDSSARVTGASLIDTYYQKTSRHEGSLNLERYTVYVLVKIDRRNLEQEQRRQEAKRISLLTNAEKVYRQGLAKQNAADYLGAVRDFKETGALLAQTDGAYGAIDSQDLSLKASAAYRDSLARLKRYRLEVAVPGHAGIAERFSEALSAALAAKGFQFDSSAVLTFKTQVHLNSSSYILGNYCYYAEGTLSAVSHGQTLGAVSFKAKGFHPTQELAQQNALQEAGRQAGAQLAESLFRDL